MKLTQDLIVFDLETTAKTNEDGTQSNDNIIQLGAVYLKRIDNKKYEIVDHFNELVKPKDETISPFITVCKDRKSQKSFDSVQKKSK